MVMSGIGIPLGYLNPAAAGSIEMAGEVESSRVQGGVVSEMIRTLGNRRW